MQEKLWEVYRRDYERYMSSGKIPKTNTDARRAREVTGTERYLGEIINGFDLIEPLQNKNAGFSRWTFARRGDRVFFLKEFLDPVYPVDPAIGERQTKARVLACREFEKKCLERYETLNAASDGNAVRLEAFFRNGSHYYVAMEKIDSTGLFRQGHFPVSSSKRRN